MPVWCFKLRNNEETGVPSENHTLANSRVRKLVSSIAKGHGFLQIPSTYVFSINQELTL